MKISLKQSSDIREYRPIIDNFDEEFDQKHIHAMLAWCDLADGKDGRYWQVWLVYMDEILVGFCGLYSLYHNKTDELWLGWFGILPEYRNQGIGSIVLSLLSNRAKEVGCTILKSYVDKDGKPLEFYKRNGFKVSGKVREFLLKCPDDNIKNNEFDDFECPDDWIIEKEL